MLTTLTARDVLLHSARVRLPAAIGVRQCSQIVADTIDLLGCARELHPATLIAAVQHGDGCARLSDWRP